MVLFEELGRILDGAAHRSIDVLAMKGVPATALLYGGDISMRPMADLDLLVRPGDLRSFLDLLEVLGYTRAAMPLDPFVGEKGRHLPPLYHPRRGATVEVHRAADYRFESIGASLLPDFFASARRGTVDGRTVLFPSWEAWIFQWAVHLVYTDAYAGKMRDLYDMAVCLETFRDEVDWDFVVHPARTGYLLRPLWTGLLLVERIFGPAIPEPWRGHLRKRAGIDYPGRELPEWLIRGSLFRGTLHRYLPLSVLAALSMPLHLPALTPRFVGEFLRTFVSPPLATLEAQYGLRRGVVNTPLLYLLRSAHLASVIANRLAGKLLPGRGPSRP
jgi:hypothetical protein